MRRNQFLAAILGMAGVRKAQAWQVWRPATMGWYDEKKVRNNQCPVCGGMAPKRKPVYGVGVGTPSEVRAEHEKAATNVARIAGSLPDGYVSREIEHEMVIRCKFCNAAFWQDAENS